MKWLTNSPKDRLTEDLAALEHESRHIIRGKPKATESMTLRDLERMDMVGIYEA